MSIVDAERNEGEFAYRLRECYPRFQPPHSLEMMIIEHLHLRWGVLVERRCPQLNGAGRIGKPRRHYADHGVRPRIEEDRFAQNGGIAAETPLPQAPAQKDSSIR